MNRYEKGKIYQIVDVGFNKCYIGSTCESLSKRMERHRKDYKEYCQKKQRTYPSSILLFDEFGLEHCKILLIENYPCSSREELEAKEGEYQRTHTCINKNLAGRNHIQYYLDNKERLKQKAREYYKNNKDVCDERNKMYAKEHQQEVKKYKQEWYIQNKEHRNQKGKEHYQNNREEQLRKKQRTK